MLRYEERSTQANLIYQQGLENVKNNPEPKGQKFHVGERVKIADKLCDSMSHFECGVEANVRYVYAHAYGGNDISHYSLKFDNGKTLSWYREHQLSFVI